MSEEDLYILPPELQQILKRKSSRDPNSRFSTKLHLLLSFVSKSNDKEMENKIGCAWNTDDEFRINKQTISRILGIKVNTLNVDLNSLKFKQLKHNKNGWTVWHKDGFTRTSIQPDTPTSQQVYPQQINTQNLPMDPNIKLGHVTQAEYHNFMSNCRRIWNELINPTFEPAETNYFIQRTAERFREKEQPLENSKDVLRAIIAPEPDQKTVSFKQFCSFMAMFGPEDTIMQKIASLLSNSNHSGQWLSFTKIDPLQSSLSILGQFDENEPNCLVLTQLNKNGVSYTKIWNLPLASCRENYIADQQQIYPSWDSYFSMNPVLSAEPYYPAY